MLIAINILLIGSCIRQIVYHQPVGDEPPGSATLIILTAVVLLFSASVPFASLHAYINEEGVYVKFTPFLLRYTFYDWNIIEAAYVRKYNPLLEFGGWGFRVPVLGFPALRVTKKRVMVFTMYGRWGVQLVLKNHTYVLSEQTAQMTCSIR